MIFFAVFITICKSIICKIQSVIGIFDGWKNNLIYNTFSYVFILKRKNCFLVVEAIESFSPTFY